MTLSQINPKTVSLQPTQIVVVMSIAILLIILSTTDAVALAGYLDDHLDEIESGKVKTFGSELDLLIEEFRTVMDTTATRLTGTATWLLAILFGVDLVYNMGRSIFGSEPFGQMFGRLFFRTLYVGIIATLINFAPDMLFWLAETGTNFAGLISPSGTTENPNLGLIMTDGIRMAKSTVEQIKLTQPFALFYPLIALWQLLVTGVVIAIIIVIYAEIYLVGLMGLLVLAFGGWDSTKGAAETYLKTLIGKAFKLAGVIFIFTFMGILGNTLASQGVDGLGLEMLLVLAILELIRAVLIITLPNTMEGLIGGITSNSSMIAGAAGLMAAKSAAKVTVAAGTGGTAGAVMAAQSAVGAVKAGDMGIGQAAATVAKGALSGAGRYASASRKGGVTSQMAKDLSGMLSKNKGGTET